MSAGARRLVSQDPAPDLSRADGSAAARARSILNALALPAILLLGIGFRLWGVAWGLQNANVSRRPHPDEWAVYWLFHWFDKTHSLNPCPRYPGQCFFDWGSAYPYLAYALHFLIAPFLALVPSSTFGPQGDPSFIHAILAARLVSAAASTATIYVAYLLGRTAFGRGAGLLGALLVAFSGLLIQLAHFATPDSTTILLMSLALLAIVRVREAPSIGRIALAGALTGLAAGSEYHMVLLAAPFLVAWWLCGTRSTKRLGIAAGAAAGAFLLLNAYLIVDLSGFLAAIEHTLRIRTVDSSVQYGTRWAPYDPAWLYVIRYPLGYGVGFALAGWILGGVIWAAIRRTQADLILLAWVAPYFLLVTLEPAKFMRYSAPLLVPLAILAARLGFELLHAIRGTRAVAAVALACAALLFTGSYDAAYASLFSSQDPRAAAVAWLDAHAAKTQSVAFEELPDGILTAPYFLRRGQVSCFLQQRASRLAGAAYVLLDSYTREELGTRQNAENEHLKNVLASSPSFRLVATFAPSLTFLGESFPISGSPHDWRYPDHVISIYRRVVGTPVSGSYCFTNLGVAARALYIAPSKRV